MDYNVQADVQSALYVLQRSSPTLVPIAVTAETSFRRSYLDNLNRSGPLASLIARQAEAFAEDENIQARYGKTCEAVADDTINFQHDPLTCAIALGWKQGVRIQELPIKSQVEDGWLRQSVDDRGQPMKIVTHVNGPAFNEFWLGTVTRENADELVRGDRGSLDPRVRSS
jgi:inosine-uridine nucleoside N-ribohydrolase